MLSSRRLKINDGKYYVALVAVALVAYWPLTFHVFSLKNDAISYFLPWRHQISESIQNGYFPFWSPYLYTGLPLHADIQSGVWNPLVFGISLLTSYDMSVLQWETLFYILVAGVGFFKLSHFFSFGSDASLLLSISYMCSGFMIDSGSFIPWITSSAYLPLVFLFFLKTIQSPSLKNSVALALSASLLFLAGYPSFFLFATYILIFVLIAHLVDGLRNKKGGHVYSLLIHLALAALCTFIICSPALISYVEFLPYYHRGRGLDLQASETNPFTISNTVSYLFPAASYKLHAGNDISSRNAFIGILPLAFIIYSFKSRFKIHQKVILGITTICFLFSLGAATPVHSIFYRYLPFLNTFRHPGTMRVFTSTGLLLLAGFGLKDYLENRTIASLRKVLAPLGLAILLFILYAAILQHGLDSFVSKLTSFKFDRTQAKNLLDSSTFSQWIVISGIIELLLLSVALMTRSKRAVLVSGVITMILMTFLSMPFTMVSQHHPKEVNAFIDSFPRGFPTTLAWSNVEFARNDSSRLSDFGYKDFYNKRISIQDHVVTPTVNSKYGILLRSTALDSSIRKHPFAYTDGGTQPNLTSFTPNSFSFESRGQQPTILHVIQQYNHNWHASVNGQNVAISGDNIAFMKIFLPAGINKIDFFYRSPRILTAALLSVILFLTMAGFLIFSRWIKK